MDIPLYQIDAFAQRPFTGNPAAVCPLKYWPNAALMQKIAAENNLAETAFFVKENGQYHIRWFTPTVEIELCGHATIAAAYVLWHFLGETEHTITFNSLSGPLEVTQEGTLIALNFPARVISSDIDPSATHNALHAPQPPTWAGANDGRALVHYPTQHCIQALAPNMNALKQLPYRIVYATAPGEHHDFVCRVFAPNLGIDEDPVTGSAYTALTPYWANQLKKDALQARQISARGGNVYTTFLNDRVRIAGHAVCVLKGTLFTEDNL